MAFANWLSEWLCMCRFCKQKYVYKSKRAIRTERQEEAKRRRAALVRLRKKNLGQEVSVESHAKSTTKFPDYVNDIRTKSPLYEKVKGIVGSYGASVSQYCLNRIRVKSPCFRRVFRHDSPARTLIEHRWSSIEYECWLRKTCGWPSTCYIWRKTLPATGHGK